jgi:hypothetical protein
VKREQREWLKQFQRLFLLSLFYDLVFLDPFTVIKKLNPVPGLLAIFFAGILYVVYESIKIEYILTISFWLVILGTFYVIITSFRRRPVYVFNIEESFKIVKEKGLELKDLNDLDHAKAIIEYMLYNCQNAKTVEEMKKQLDIAYDTWFKVIKNQTIYLGIFKRKTLSRN